MSVERWRPVVGRTKPFVVSDQGNVRSLPYVGIRSDGRKLVVKGQLLKRIIEYRGSKKYAAVTLGRGDRPKISELMLESFVGPRPFPGALARHLNDNSLDDRLENLAWGTYSDNNRDRARNTPHLRDQFGRFTKEER